MAEKPPPPPPQGWGKDFWLQIYPFRQFWATLVFVAEKPPPLPPRIENFWLQIYPFQAILSNVGFCGRKAPLHQDEGNCLTSDLSISGNFEQLWFLWQKSPPPPPGWGKNFWLQIYPSQSISSNFGFLWQKSPPTPGWGKTFWLQIYPFQAILSNFGFCGRKAPTPSPRMENFFDFRSIHFRQFWATLDFVAEKPPYTRMREKFLTSDLSISGNFEQLWFLWQKSPPPPPPRMRQNFLTKIYPFQAILSNFGFCGRKAPTPSPQDGKFFDFRSIHFRQFRAMLVFVAEKPPYTKMRKIFLTSDLSISGNFQQLWFLWQKSPPPPPPGWGKVFWLQIYPFQAISATLVFVAEKPPPPLPKDEGKIFYFRSIHFRQFWATLVFVAEKPPPPHQDEGKFLTSDLSISVNFEQLGFCGRKAPLHQDEGKNFDFRSIHFRQFWATLVFVAEKPPPLPPRMENFLTSDLSISGNFEQRWFFVAEKPSPQDGKCFDFRSIHFRQFWATLVFVAEKPPPRWGKFFWLQIYPFHAISKQLWFLWQKSPPPPPGWGKLFWLRSIHFRQFWATLVFVAEKPPPLPPRIENFWLQIYPFQAILSNVGFCGRKTPLHQDEGKFFDFRSIHFRQFWATLVFVAEKPPPPPPTRMRETFLTSDLSISVKFEQLWFLWQKSPPTPGWGKIFWLQIYPFQAILSNFGFCGRKAPTPSPQDGKFFWLQIHPFQAILSNFGFCGRKAPPTPGWGKIFDFRSIHFRQFWATLVFVAEKPPPPQDEANFLTSDLSILCNFQQLWFLWQKSPPPPPDEGKFFD